MIKSLSVRNYALIDKIEISLKTGFSVITGETGAGKSILLGALGLILGNRADTGVLKNKSKKCIVEGEFSLDTIDLQSFFLENDLDYEETAILRREINHSGKSRAFINDSPVNLNLLRTLGEQLVNIHSQHQTLLLGKFSFQLNVLDAYINNPSLGKSYTKEYHAYKKAKQHLDELTDRINRLKSDEDYIRFQLNEFASVELDEDVYRQLKEREQLLNHADEIASGIGRCIVMLDEGDVNALQILRETVQTTKKLSGFHPSIVSLSSRLESVEIELQDILREMVQVGDVTEVNPEEVEEIKNKLDIYYRLQQKHHIQSIAELNQLRELLSGQLNSIENFDEERQDAENNVVRQKEKLKKIAQQLHTTRGHSAGLFAEEVRSLLQQLGMKNARFEVEVTDVKEFTETGSDKVEFLFNANKGGVPARIAQIASGGEFSRLMLAIKSLINQKNLLPTVIFDEIDAGVSGEIAGKVGKILSDMSKNHQVLVITHLPQIASKAENHYHVLKDEQTATAQTIIEMLDDDRRVEVIARMMSDEKITESAVKTARELLS